MTKDKNENSLQKRFSTNNNEDNFSESEPQSFERKRPRVKRDDNILSSDDFSISETSIDYTPKRRQRTDNWDDRKNKDYSNSRKNSSGKSSFSNRKNDDRDNKKTYPKRKESDSYHSDKSDNRKNSNRSYSDRNKNDRDRRSSKYDDDKKNNKHDGDKRKNYSDDRKTNKNSGYNRSRPKTKLSSDEPKDGNIVRLNKFIADSGLCSRRQADTLIASGSVKVNGIVVDKVGTKINRTDKVQVGGETLFHEKLKYLLLNKPKGYVTTMSDPEKRNTVLQLVHHACKERIYPVGRLDRNTSGLLLFTNDGDLANKLMHPRSKIEKVYFVELDKPLTKNDMITIANGIELEDGFIKVDNIDYNSTNNKKEIGIQLHSGKNRIIRRIFESLGYEVVKLDRTLYAGLTKKDLPRGKWRFLTETEISFLKMI